MPVKISLVAASGPKRAGTHEDMATGVAVPAGLGNAMAMTPLT